MTHLSDVLSLLPLTKDNSDHARTLGELPDEYLRDIGPVIKKVALSTGVEQYNVMQVCQFFYINSSLRGDLTLALE